MKIRAITLPFLSVLLLFSIISCGNNNKTKSKETAKYKDTLFVANYPLYSITKALIGDQVELYFPASSVADPAYWSPNKQELHKILRCNLIILNGANYEPWINQAAVSQKRSVNTTKSFENQLILNEHSTSHTHGGNTHAHGAIAHTTWLDFSFASEQSKNVAASLQQNYPKQADSIAIRLSKLEKQLLELHSTCKQLATATQKISIVYSHPVYQYFETAYNTSGTSVHWEPEDLPSEQKMQELKAMNLKEKRVFIWEDKPTQAMAQAIEQMGFTVITFSPLGNADLNQNFMDQMKTQVADLVETIEGL